MVAEVLGNRRTWWSEIACPPLISENKRPFHNMGNSLEENRLMHFLRSDIKDVMTGYRAFSYLFVKTFGFIEKGSR